MKAGMRTMQLQHQTVLLAVLATSSLLLCSAADAAQPTAAAAKRPEASSSCRVAFPNTCVCQAGSCAGCAQCAGCPDSLCVAAPDVTDAPAVGTRNTDAVPLWQREEQPAALRALRQTASKTPTTAQQQAAQAPAATTPQVQDDPAINKVTGLPVQQAVQRGTTAPTQQQASSATPATPPTPTTDKPAAATPKQAATKVPAVNATAVPAAQSDVLICDGNQHTIVVPTKLSPYTLPPGMSCSRPQGGTCSALQSIACLPFTDNNGLIGPVTYGDTQGGSAPLLIHPDNPLVFAMQPGHFMTYVAWTVYDVGTGGAKMVGKYPAGSQIADDKIEHGWTLPPGPVDGDNNCDVCSDCNMGKGIKEMRLDARPGTGYAAFEISQLYGSPRCGKSCFDLDGSYWTGMTYACMQPTCGDTDLSRPGKQQYACPAGFSYKAGADSVASPSDSNCCKFAYTCGDTSPLPGDQPFPCLTIGGCDSPPFETSCFQYNPKAADTPIDPEDPNTSLDDLVPVCCTKKSPPASAPDVYVVKQTNAPKARPVGSQFTFTIEVGVRGLATAVARNVVLEDEVPAGLLLDGVTEEHTPFENACQTVTAHKFRCTWPVLLFQDVRVVQVTVTSTTAGSYTNTAFVKTASGDTNPNNNQDSDTVEVKGACCNSRVSPPSCSEVPSKASCPDPNTFYNSKNCNEVPCGPIPGGACCLELLGQCIERTYETACSAAGGTWYQGKLCDELRKQGTCRQPSGACCNVRSGECFEDKSITQCDLKWSTWWKNGSCSSDGYCSGACCDTANGNCYQSKKADCASPTQLWTIYGQCDPLKCPNGDTCTPPWYKCKPKFWGKGEDECCSGYSCQEAPKGCKVGKYVCQPKFTPSCGQEGFSCGGKSGAVCCEGFACYWDYKQHKGSCHPEPNPDYCRKDGDQCGDDRDCCYGSRCCFPQGKSKLATKRLAKHGGQCTPVTYEKCHKECFDYNCFVERKKDCNAFYATSAAKLSAAGAKYMV
ncbi:hypothetical protein OEZ86_013203 [Tetradesmus obliquus]|nr:hypothetical protein OEZ86_013203 [Tetradesmus obliquus]